MEGLVPRGFAAQLLHLGYPKRILFDALISEARIMFKGIDLNFKKQ